jgi:hypothetical protein
VPRCPRPFVLAARALLSENESLQSSLPHLEALLIDVEGVSQPAEELGLRLRDVAKRNTRHLGPGFVGVGVAA